MPMSSINDIIADMLTRLRNASLVKREEVRLPKSKLTVGLAHILCQEGFVDSVNLTDPELGPYHFQVRLKYRGKEKTPGFLKLERISKPGRRIYTRSNRIPKTLGGFGITILSTSEGLITDQTARQRKLGGEVLCSIY
jgi:small subunit ribosomal protein S8